MPTKESTTATFADDVLNSPTPTLVEFWATWCPPCRALAPTLEHISNEKSEVMNVVKVDVDENPELAAKYRITSIPTMFLFKDGEIQKELIGAFPKDELLEEIAPHL